MFKFITGIFIGIIAGATGTYYFTHTNTAATDRAPAAAAQQKVAATTIKYPLKASLFRFEMNKRKQNEFNEWMQWHHDEYAAIIETMEREKMYSEAIFTDSLSQPGILYWLTIDGEGGAPVNNSPLKIDSVHNQYMKEVLRKGSRSTLKTEFYLIPEFLQNSIADHQLTEK